MSIYDSGNTLFWNDQLTELETLPVPQPQQDIKLETHSVPQLLN